jgi:alginate O-acetyltransferase complex protein AlgI
MTDHTVYYLVFAALLVPVAFVRGARTRRLVFVAASYAFYAAWGAGFLAVLIISSLLNYFFGALLRRRATPFRLWLGVLLNLLLLAFCKYFAALLDVGAWQADLLSHVIRPVGISFWTLQGLSYLFDVYREEELDPSFTEFLLFMAFWPTVLAGPVCRLPSMLPQFRHLAPASWGDISVGLTRVLQGLFMKLVLVQLLAYGLSSAAAAGSATARGGLDTSFLAVAFGFHLFFDFAGYSHLAIGAARMFGIRLPENFAHPFLSLTPSVFWTRWHMSFSFWIRDYVFVPLATMRREWWWMYLALLVSMTLVGVWHGIAATFVLWGIYHGLLLVLHRIGQRLAQRCPFDVPKPLARPLSWAATFVLVSLGWIFFRAADVAEAVRMFGNLVRPHHFFDLLLPRRFYITTASIVLGYFICVGLQFALARWRSQWAVSGTPAETGFAPHRLATVSANLLEFGAARRWWVLGPALVIIGLFVGLAFLNHGAAVRTTPFVYTLF